MNQSDTVIPDILTDHQRVFLRNKKSAVNKKSQDICFLKVEEHLILKKNIELTKKLQNHDFDPFLAIYFDPCFYAINCHWIV